MFITIILKWYYSHGQSQICMCALYFTLDYIFTVYLLKVNVRKNIVLKRALNLIYILGIKSGRKYPLLVYDILIQFSIFVP